MSNNQITKSKFSLKSTLLNIGGFLQESVEFAAPGLIGGTAIIVASSPTMLGYVTINLALLGWFVLFMLLMGVAFTLLKRYIISEFESGAYTLQAPGQ
jgi:hypothetical protein